MGAGAATDTSFQRLSPQGPCSDSLGNRSEAANDYASADLAVGLARAMPEPEPVPEQRGERRL